MWTWKWQYTAYDANYIKDFYKYVEPGTGRRYRLSDLTGPGGAAKGNPQYEIMGVVRHWRFSKEKMAQLMADGRVVQTRPGAVPAQKRYLDEMPGVPLQNDWADIGRASGKGNLGYDTQKPVALLERIIAASSNEADLVLDPFCGCGTTVHAAEKLKRRWIGIDITHLAIGLVRRRLIEAFPRAQFEIVGVPKDVGAARELAAADKHQFQLWALSMIEAQPFRGGRKGADGGVDGYLYFKPDGKTTEKAVVSVKGGGSIGVGMIRDLIATVDRDCAKMGVFLTLEDPTVTMRKEAAAAGLYKTAYGSFAKIQILTIEDLFNGQRPHMPWIDPSAFKKARRETTEWQQDLGL